MARTPIKFVYAGTTSNETYPTSQSDIEAGILFKGEVKSNQLNGIEKINQTALRELQTAGGFYDNQQIYNKNNIVFQLVSENGVIKERMFLCKNNGTTGKPPLSGDSYSNFNDINILTYNSNLVEDTTNWDRILRESQAIKKFTTTANNNVMLIPTGYKDLCTGILRVRLKADSSDYWDCVFDIVLGGSTQNFKIQNVVYSDNVRKSNNLCDGIAVGFPGFFLSLDTTNQMSLGIKNNTFCQTMEVDYSHCNFIPNPSNIAFSYGKPYAVRQNGGSYIEDLGDIKPNLRNQTAASGCTYDFYLFARGCVQWIAGITLDSTYYHQWANGGMPSISIDVSDCVLRNKGAKAGQSNGVIQNPQLPDVTWNNKNKDTSDNRKIGMWLVFRRNYYGGFSDDSGLSFVPSADVLDATGVSGATGNYAAIDYKMSRINPIYTDGGEVRMKTLVSTYLLQAF